MIITKIPAYWIFAMQAKFRQSACCWHFLATIATKTVCLQEKETMTIISLSNSVITWSKTWSFTWYNFHPDRFSRSGVMPSARLKTLLFYIYSRLEECPVFTRVKSGWLVVGGRRCSGLTTSSERSRRSKTLGLTMLWAHSLKWEESKK